MFGEILFALIYSSYKSGSFRSGKGYLWRSNQAISLPFSFAVTLVFALVSGFELQTFNWQEFLVFQRLLFIN
jgi:hypothetical protein